MWSGALLLPTHQGKNVIRFPFAPDIFCGRPRHERIMLEMAGCAGRRGVSKIWPDFEADRLL